MPEETISIVIPTFERRGALVTLLDDLSRQTRLPLELIVVDQSLLEPFDEGAVADSLRPLVRCLRQAVPNAQVARNRGIAEAAGTIILLLDDDMRVGERFVESHLANYLADPELAGVAGQVLKQGQKETLVPGPESRWPVDGWMMLPLNYAARRDAINWPSCNASIRRKWAIRIGGFDENFVRTWFDDSDFSWRLHQAGARVVFDPACSAVHLKVPSGGKRPTSRDRWVLADTESWGGMFYFWRKNFGLCRVWRHVARTFKRNFCRICFLARPDQFLRAAGTMLAGYRWASARLHEGPRYAWSPEPARKNPAT
jgi:GT2 family glycosyltransferase